ncbi:ABC transporter substrate-binding protein [Actinoplanes sp. NPDC023801]|uniref:ABC transporter substrate-binding protein n=1 Tax=Actinoplanes sp. NPDC023801 TaxID=3154595 RepID=UPI0033D84B7F
MAGLLAVVAPLTGPRGRWGSLFPADLLKHPAVTVHDDGADPERSVALARQIAATPGIRAVAGHFSSEAAAGALPVYRQAGIPVAFPLSSAPGVTREHLNPEPGVIAPMPDNVEQAAALWQSAGGAGTLAWAGASATGLAVVWAGLGGQLRPTVAEVLAEPGVSTLVVLGTLTDAEHALAVVAASGRRIPVVLSDDSWVGSAAWDGLVPEVVTTRPDPAVLVDRCARHMLEAVRLGLTGAEIVTLWARRHGIACWEKPQPLGVRP